MFSTLFTRKKLNTHNIQQNEIKQEEIKSDHLNKLPDDILHHVFELTGPKETALTIAQTSKEFNQLFQVSQEEKFIYNVVYGEQGQAEAILKKLKEAKQEKTINQLLSQKITGTDPAGRTFNKITAFQYALWALDTNMWRMILKYFSRGENEQISSLAKKQYEELKYFGVEYQKPIFNEIKAETICKEKHFDFSPIIDALQVYVDNSNTWPHEQCNDYLCTVIGGHQRNFPMHVVNEYCHPSRSFNPVPDFKETLLPRQHKVAFFFGSSDSSLSWFDNKSLGVDVGIFRADNAGAVQRGLWYFDRTNWRESAIMDLAALKALFKKRRDELELFNNMELTSSGRISNSSRGRKLNSP